jgi:hypothetical protein
MAFHWTKSIKDSVEATLVNSNEIFVTKTLTVVVLSSGAAVGLVVVALVGAKVGETVLGLAVMVALVGANVVVTLSTVGDAETALVGALVALTGASVDGASVMGALVTGASVTGALVTGAFVTGAFVTGAFVAGALVSTTGDPVGESVSAVTGALVGATTGRSVSGTGWGVGGCGGKVEKGARFGDGCCGANVAKGWKLGGKNVGAMADNDCGGSVVGRRVDGRLVVGDFVDVVC